ncbi:tail tape measure protein [Novosphingobium sp.]|uniref:tail tape measure protein n=1 Tax=Novosphingobium sp. TaxID=1874826 RepID=UPI0025D375A5|nr:tail tape measure protein [Novosphingobium sp.]MCC6926112.1 tail tape measure protein [Novosphingobium sp.]
MTDPVDSLMLEVRANTQAFAADVATMRGAFDGTLVDGFAQAGNILERGLLTALRKGSIGFEDLRRIALNVIDQIASRSLNNLFSSIGLGGQGGGNGGGGLLGSIMNIGNMVASLFGLPGRATGGPVSPGRGYMVGERGPELFVPTSAGRIEAMLPGRGRDVKVSITIAAPQGTSAPQALQRSSRQVASAVRRALSEF